MHMEIFYILRLMYIANDLFYFQNDIRNHIPYYDLTLFSRSLKRKRRDSNPKWFFRPLPIFKIGSSSGRIASNELV